MSEWHGELRLLAIDADRVVFLRHPEDEISLTVGRRYAVALVEINDDEQLAPDEPERTSVQRVKRNPSNVAAILAKVEDFQRFAQRRMKQLGAGALPVNEETATEYVRRACGITSRAELDSNPIALSIFHGIELDYRREQDDGRA